MARTDLGARFADEAVGRRPLAAELRLLVERLTIELNDLKRRLEALEGGG